MSKLASILALATFTLAILALGTTTAAAQKAAIDPSVFPFPGAGTFSGRVMSRNFYPQPIPMAGGAQPQIARWNPNQPVSGAQVTISWAVPIYFNNQLRRGPGIFPPQRTWTTTTGWDGSFNFSDLPSGPFSYTVAAPEYAQATGSFTISGDAGARQDVYLRRAANQVGSFAGRVTVAPRWPILYAKPMAANADPAAASADPAATAAAASAPVDAEEAAADKLTEPEPGATPPADASSPNGSAVAPAAGVTASNMMRPIYFGRPLPGAQVEVLSANWEIPLAANGNQSVTAPAGGAVACPIPPSPGWTTTTDQSGNFAVKGLPAGRYTYRVTHKYFQPRGGAFTVGTFETDVYRTVQLERTIRGTFAGIVGEGPQMLVPNPFSATAPAGSNATGGAAQILPFSFTPLAGARVVAVRSRFTFWPRPVPGPIPLGATTNAATANAGTANAATAAAPAGDPKAQADEDAALLKAADAGGSDSVPAADPKADAAQADAEGAASLNATAAAQPQSAAAGSSPGSPGLIMPLPPIYWPAPYYRRATTDANGRFSIASLPAGTYRFVVRDANHQPQLGWFTISTYQSFVFRRVLLPQNGGPIPIDLATISGQVLGYNFPINYAQGANTTSAIRRPDNLQPLAGAQVSLTAVARPGELVAQYIETTTTDSNGNFSFSNRAMGIRYNLSVSADGFSQTSQEVTVGFGSQNLRVYLKPAFIYATPNKAVEAVPATGNSVENPFSK